eukprot:CAMPEP_0198137968 /NCGR_PEP_ID=MMETSP1443-20131203/1392_1 /TAXON_ID=186043 /ORGANISM="Entomoneis sp., Strain CCMP2396" /LENGTH=286 /DNA_ID=CAMNT_0043799559 /DNA_START=109 /DNA_END=969 /DNA_ORIENTATION=+
MSTLTLPSSLNSSAISSLCPPGQCQFGDDLTAVPLLERIKVSETSSLLKFGLPDDKKALGLSTCACILAKTEIDGETVVRPYTPISTNAMVGSFDLLIKNYGPTAKMSRHLHGMAVGDTSVSFKHISFNIKIQAPFGVPSHILMLVGGTGIAPMIQALHDILGNKEQSKKPLVTVLYGSKESSDILGKELLDRWVAEYPNQLNVVHVLSDEPADSKWEGLRGYITKDLISNHFPAADDTSDDKKLQVWICGPPPMYNALCGPREDKDQITGVLGDMSYSPEQVEKF